MSRKEITKTKWDGKPIPVPTTGTHRLANLNDEQWELLSELVDEKQGALFIEDQNGGADDDESRITQKVRDLLDEAWGG